MRMQPTRWQLDHTESIEPPKLNGGFIPSHTECPFASECDVKRAGQCFHTGITHPAPFACKLIDLHGRLKRLRAA